MSRLCQFGVICLEEKQSLRTLTPVFLQRRGPASKLSLLGWVFFYVVGEDAVEEINIEGGFVKQF